MKTNVFTAILFFFLFIACEEEKKKCLDTGKYLDYGTEQVMRTLSQIPEDSLMPRAIPHGDSTWEMVNIYDWTSGFFPGILWYMYEYNEEEYWKSTAKKWTAILEPVKQMDKKYHDLGFMMYCSFGNGYRLTGNEEYKEILLETADSLTRLFNPNVGTIVSWPWGHGDWAHNTIIDNMMNLELLFWAAKNGGGQRYYDIAYTHAKTTMENHIRDDNTTYHVVNYDTTTGDFIQGITHQGYSDSSTWARGQAWGIYGFTMSYRETGEEAFLETAKRLANPFLERLPEDHVPYWDFDAPHIPDEPKDASAAAIAASALLELSTLVNNPDEQFYYRDMANKMLHSLSENYLSGDENPALLKHSVGSKPHGKEIDYSINYADYYYIEALLREKALQETENDTYCVKVTSK
ncbi:MAG: glucuronyl hydrolase [Bacteroidota bacterium]